MRQVAEPALERPRNTLLRYFAATRPGFLSVTFVGCLLGVASAVDSGVRLDFAAAAVTLVFALVAHAGANVLNDYYDALNGSDADNGDRIYPFTGGSRFIQNGVLTAPETGRFGYALMAVVIPAGLWLAALSAPGLLLIGLAGLFVGWAYSAPPLRLMSRGLGEIAITAAWLLVVVGSDYVQRRSFSFAPVAAGLGFALLVANVLYMNQFPDVRADARAGKKTLVVRLGVARARWGYALMALLAYAWLFANTLAGRLPSPSLLAIAPAALSYAAARRLWDHAGNPSSLEPAIKSTILAAVLYGLVLAGVLAFS